MNTLESDVKRIKSHAGCIGRTLLILVLAFLISIVMFYTLRLDMEISDSLETSYAHSTETSAANEFYIQLTAISESTPTP